MNNMDVKQLLITIDGPAGAGKTTVIRLLSNCLGYKYVDTGALYRAVALNVIAGKLSPEDDVALERLCQNLHLEFVQEEIGTRLYANGSDITDQIRTPVISMLASAVSARPVVRRYLLKVQRYLGEKKGAIFEGRDMGTVVFPEADVKFYVDASHKMRALRRYNEMDTGIQSLEQVEDDMKRRDENDSKRDLAPLKPAQDAIRIDTTYLTAAEVVEHMMYHVEKRLFESYQAGHG